MHMAKNIQGNSEEQQNGKTFPPYIKANSETVTIKIVRYLYRNRQLNQWNRMMTQRDTNTYMGI